MGPSDDNPYREELERERAARASAERLAEETSIAHAELLDGLEAAKEEILAAKQEILQLSNLVLPIWKNVLLMPVIGRVDAERASLLRETVVEAAVREEATVAILDVSGVPMFDRHPGHVLCLFHDALALVGTRMVLCGVRPEVAHGAALGTGDAGASLDRIPTRRTLSDALRWAIENSDE